MLSGKTAGDRQTIVGRNRGSRTIAQTGRSGPLAGLRCVEFAGMGPGPHCGMMLSDLGADVLRIERPNPASFTINPVAERGRAKLVLDLRQPEGAARALEIVSQSDVLIEGNRPGVMERLGLGPGEAIAANPRLIYGRMTGWGQNGPLAARAGHDLSYLAITGALHAFARKEGLSGISCAARHNG